MTLVCQEIRTAAEKTVSGRSPTARLAASGDLARLLELDRACFGDRAWSRAAWREVVTLPDWTTVVVDGERTVVAASVLLLAAPASRLASLAVDPGWRRQGLARFLLRDALARAQGAAAGWLSLEVDRGNRGAVALYRREGFGVLRRFREDGIWRQEMIRRVAFECEPRPPVARDRLPVRPERRASGSLRRARRAPDRRP